MHQGEELEGSGERRAVYEEGFGYYSGECALSLREAGRRRETRRGKERKREIELNACFVSFVHLQDPHNLSARDLTKFDYVKTGKTAVEAKEVDRLSGINVGASGSAARILEEVAKKVSLLSIRPSS